MVAQIILCCGDASCVWKGVLSSTPARYLLEASIPVLLRCDYRNVPRHCHMSPLEVKITSRVENHCSNRFCFVLVSKTSANMYYSTTWQQRPKAGIFTSTEEETGTQMSHILPVLKRQATRVSRSPLVRSGGAIQLQPESNFVSQPNPPLPAFY